MADEDKSPEDLKEEGRREVYKQWAEAEEARAIFESLREIREIAMRADIKATIALAEVTEEEAEEPPKKPDDTVTTIEDQKPKKDEPKTDEPKNEPKPEARRRRVWG